MIHYNKPTKNSESTNLQRSDFEHRATWFALLIEEAKKRGLDDTFAREAIHRCGVFHGQNKFPITDDMEEFAAAFANQDVINTFEMEVLECSSEKLSINFHYCPLVKAWEKLGISDEEIAKLCDIAMDGDRGIISTYPCFAFDLGKTIAKGDEVCEIRITKH